MYLKADTDRAYGREYSCYWKGVNLDVLLLTLVALFVFDLVLCVNIKVTQIDWLKNYYDKIPDVRIDATRRKIKQREIEY